MSEHWRDERGEDVHRLRAEMNARLAAVERRFDQRCEILGTRCNSMSKRFDDLYEMLIGLCCLSVLVLSFVLCVRIIQG